jgi:glutathione peroxidase
MKLLLISAIAISVVTVAYVMTPSKLNSNMTPKQKILKLMYPFIMKMGSKKTKTMTEDNIQNTTVDFYSLKIELNDGTAFDFSKLKGKKILLVNTASNCGFTRQYEGLETLYQQQKEHLIIIGFPANDFGKQEPGTDSEIATFCKKNYGVTFPLMEKSIVIKGNHQNEVHKWLSDMTINGWCQQEPTWNFCKYLVNEQGVLTHYFPMTVDPLAAEVIAAIETNK